MPNVQSSAAVRNQVRDTVTVYRQQVAIVIVENDHHVATSIDQICESLTLLAQVKHQLDTELLRPPVTA